MQLYLGFRDIPEANVWERLDATQRAAVIPAAAKLLREHHISSLVVSSPAGPAGIITERDYVNMVADGQDPAGVSVADRMTTNLITVSPGTDAADAAHIMAEHHIRHLPVVDKGRLIGIISIRDPVVREEYMTWLSGELASSWGWKFPAWRVTMPIGIG